MTRVSSIVVSVLAGILSVGAAFFIVLNAIFSDVFGFQNHLILLGSTLVVYGVFGFVFSLAAPDGWHRWIHIFSWPAIVIVVLFSLGEFSSRAILHLTYADAAVTGVALASWAGLMLRRRRVANDPEMRRAKQVMPKLVGLMVGLLVIGVLVSSRLEL